MMPQLIEAVRAGNQETGGRVLEFSGTEYMVRGRGYVKNISDIENIVIKTDRRTGAPILVKNIGRVEIGPDMRRGVTDFNGMGDAVGGVVIMRQGENALNVIERVKHKIEEIQPSLPQGVRIVSVYDRSGLIERSIETLKHELLVEVIIVSLVILIFLWHIPSAIVPIMTIPISVFLAFIPMYLMGLTTNIMSLAGIAISIGVLVDGAIVEVENAYKKIEEWNTTGRHGSLYDIRLNAMKQVAPSVFFSLLVIAVSFLPIFTLIEQEGRLFRPLAVSKTLAMVLAACLAITIDPALRMLFAKVDFYKFRPNWLCAITNQIFVGRYYAEENHPISKILFKYYEPAVHYVLKHSKATLLIAVFLMLSIVPVFLKMGSEFMPPLNEGAILYMPTAFPGMSVTEAQRILQAQDKILKEFPEVETVFGKAGRADTSTDPAPFSMVETTVVLKPKNQWPRISGKQRTFDELQSAMNEKLAFAGIPNIWTMPIKNRIDMLSTGIRTPIGIKVIGPDLKVIQSVAEDIEATIHSVPGTRNVYAERAAEGYYLDFVLKREELARYGISIQDAQMIVGTAIGGENIAYTIEGRERYPIHVRYSREFREDVESLKRILVPTPGGAHIPMAQIANIDLVKGPSMIRNENGMLAAYVFIDIVGRDVGSYIKDAKKLVSDQIKTPSGYSLIWSGQYENMIRVKNRLKVILPLTLFVIALLLFMNTKSFIKTGIVMLAVPFSLIGGVWLLYILGYHMSIAVWVGMIALMGLDAETGVFMLLYLDLAYEDRIKSNRMNTTEDLKSSISEGAVKRIRPKLMTVMAAFMGLMPIMFSFGTGSDVMKRIAAPMVGGLATSFILELLVYPVIFYLWKSREMK